jgi:hypothetical protein
MLSVPWPTERNARLHLPPALVTRTSEKPARSMKNFHSAVRNPCSAPIKPFLSAANQVRLRPLGFVDPGSTRDAAMYVADPPAATVYAVPAANSAPTEFVVLMRRTSTVAARVAPVHASRDSVVRPDITFRMVSVVPLPKSVVRPALSCSTAFGVNRVQSCVMALVASDYVGSILYPRSRRGQMLLWRSAYPYWRRIEGSQL